MKRLSEPEVKYALLTLVCILCLSMFQIPNVQASGPSSISPFTIEGTTISASFSYQDSFHFNEANGIETSAENVALSVSVTFNNASISAVHVTSIYYRLYNLQYNITEAAYEEAPPTDYAGAYWVSSYEGFSSSSAPYEIDRSSLGQTVSLDVNPVPLEWTYQGENLPSNVQARLFVEMRFRLIDSNGNAIWFGTPMVITGSNTGPSGETITTFTGGSSYSLLTYYTGEGETPYVILNPPSENLQQTGLFSSSSVSILAIAFVAAIIGVTIGVIVVKRNRQRGIKKPKR
jgi:hypothetical protein